MAHNDRGESEDKEIEPEPASDQNVGPGEKKDKNKMKKKVKSNLLRNPQLENIRLRAKLIGISIIILLIFAVTLGISYYFLIDKDQSITPTLDEDSDGDGLTDSEELDRELNPLDIDTDGDGMPDGWEVKYDLNPLLNDSGSDQDLDGYDADQNGKLEINEYYTNFEEYQLSSNPKISDTDNDGMPDGWEVYYREKIEKVELKYWLSEKPEKLDPNNAADANLDFDFSVTIQDGLIKGYSLQPDKLSNLKEYNLGTDPTNPDTDSDGLTDYDEVEKYDTSPILLDTDNDKLRDGWEVKYGGMLFGLDPTKADTDGDGINDTVEDLDNDTLWNLDEYNLGTSPLSKDTDADSLPDDWEDQYHKNVGSEPSPDPITPDGEDDYDNDGLANIDEYKFDTHPLLPDTDNDGLLDGREVGSGFFGVLMNGSYITNKADYRYFTDPLNPDSDNDGINDSEEVEPGVDGFVTNATNIDSDGDGINDSEEILPGLDGFNTYPNSSDTDSDFLTDFEEITGFWGYNTFPTIGDHDNDGLLDGLEILTDFFPFSDFNSSILGCVEHGELDGTNPMDNDTDDDGIEDGWEAKFGFADRKLLEDTNLIEDFDYRYGYSRYGFNYSEKLSKNTDISGVWLVNPLEPRDRSDDTDQDGWDANGDKLLDSSEELTNIIEFGLKTNPLKWNSDEDIMPDGWEYYYREISIGLGIYLPDPTVDDGDVDLDNDGIIYYINNIQYVDTFTNKEEYLAGTDPNEDDTNGNGKKDYLDIWLGDDDSDGLLNGFEILFNGKITSPNGYVVENPIPWGFDPLKNDTNNNGIEDGNEDYDNDGYNNWEEQYIYGHIDVGRIIHSPGPGCSDPTNNSITPETVKKGIKTRSRSRGHVYELGEQKNEHSTVAAMIFKFNLDLNTNNIMRKKSIIDFSMISRIIIIIFYKPINEKNY